MNSLKVKKHNFRHSRLDPESSNFNMFWIMAFAGMTAKKSFYETIKIKIFVKSDHRERFSCKKSVRKVNAL